MKQDNGRNMLSNAILAIILILAVFGVIGAHLKIAELKEDNAELNNRVAAAEKKNGEISEEILQTEVNLNILVKYIDATDKKIEKLETEVAALKKEIRKKDKKHTAEIENITATLANVEKDITELKGLLKRHADDLMKLTENIQAAFNDNNENLSLVVAKMNEIIDFANDASKKMEKLEMDLNDLKNKRTCPLPPWKKRK